ncbi:hypothetical protein BJX68DRAFT_264137 [Aspergillus pseudodeflectus]|uniref:Uncharacterized protein n=1 Tax=Aspergillus pseudodeflectus TaxID=176178 RepID=A0ABR4KU28_9EURO
MQFSKILTTAFLAVAATAAPAPQTYTVDFGAIQAFSQHLQAICNEIQANVASASGEFNNVIAGFQGGASQSYQQLWGQVEAGNGQIQQACASIVSGLSSATETYDQAESENAAAFADIVAGFGKN